MNTFSRSHTLSSGFDLEIVSSIRELGVEEWNGVVKKDNFFMQHHFLRVFEEQAPENMGFHYALLRENDKVKAAFCFQVILLTAGEIGMLIKPVSSDKKSPAIANQWGEWLQRKKKDTGMRVLINGNNCISGEYGVAIADDADNEKVYNALAETVKLIMKNDVAPVRISSVLVKDHFANGEEKLAVDTLKKKRYHRFIVEPEMIVDTDPQWKTFEDYLNAMSKKYRKRAKDVMKASADLEVKEFSVREMEEKSELLHKLYLNLHNKAKFKLASLTADYFVEMKRNFPDEFRVFAYELDGKIVAFRSSFTTPSHLEAHYIGMDYELNSDLHIYQRILYDYVGQSILSGQRPLYLGRTASEMKSTVGAKAKDLVCYMRHRNGFSNQVIRHFVDYLQPSSWIPRNPFKEGTMAE